MTTDRVERRLAAILSADVVGYSRLMGADEEGTLARLKALRREFFDPKIAEHRGRMVKLMGDGALVEFASGVDAVRCAVEMQQEISQVNAGALEDQRIEFRIGVNLGDVIIEGDDIYGDGVNVAARLHEICEPGDVYISGGLYDQVHNKLAATFEDLGERSVRNIANPIRVYAVGATTGSAVRLDRDDDALPLPSKPSIAVLPFTNMSGDPDQEYFSDGIADDIITGLSGFRDLFVIARNSSFTYRGRTVDIKQVGRELGVRYVLEGGVRKAGSRVRITTQLIEAATGNHLWAEKYDGDVSDIFDLQDSITANVVGAIQPTVFLAEIERARRKRPDNLDAYDMYMRGWAHHTQMDRQNLLEARECFLKAIELDERLAQAHTGLAGTHFWEMCLDWSANPDQSLDDALRAAQRAVNIDEFDAAAHVWVGFASLFSKHFDVALAAADRAVELSPNNAMARTLRATAYGFTGRPEEGVEACRLALRLSPRDWYRFLFLHTLAFCHYVARDYGAAVEAATKVVALRPDYIYGHEHLAQSCAQLGQTERARAAFREARRLNPNFDLAFAKRTAPFMDAADPDHVLEGLRKAGWEA